MKHDDTVVGWSGGDDDGGDGGDDDDKYIHEHDDIYRYRYMGKISKIRVLEAIGALVAAEELVREAHVAAHATDSTLCVHHFSEGSIF